MTTTYAWKDAKKDIILQTSTEVSEIKYEGEEIILINLEEKLQSAKEVRDKQQAKINDIKTQLNIT